ncbi:MAG TPA: hypothetical protein PK299_16095, partial [Anaerolineales bacterium]|nr:hypothetical protein [Anaerolineales bacterium]
DFPPDLKVYQFNEWVDPNRLLITSIEKENEDTHYYHGFLNIQTGTYTKFVEGSGLAPYYSAQTNMLYYWRIEDKMFSEERNMYVSWDMWRYAKPIDAPLSEKGTPFWREESLFNPNPQRVAELSYDETRQQWWAHPLVPANSPSLLAVTDVLQAQTLDVSPSQWFYPKFTRPELIEELGPEITQVNPHFQALFQPNGNQVLFLGIYWSILYDLQSGQACELDLGKLTVLGNSEFQAWAHYATWSPNGTMVYLTIPKMINPANSSDYQNLFLNLITGKKINIDANIVSGGFIWLDETTILTVRNTQNIQSQEGELISYNLLSGEIQVLGTYPAKTFQDIYINQTNDTLLRLCQQETATHTTQIAICKQPLFR